MKNVTQHFYTTIAGIVTGAAAGALLAYQSGEVTKEALITGAVIGAIGAVLKDPNWLEKYKSTPIED